MKQSYKLCPGYSVDWASSAGTDPDVHFSPLFPAIDACARQVSVFLVIATCVYRAVRVISLQLWPNTAFPVFVYAWD